jgi:hypothetical protein
MAKYDLLENFLRVQNSDDEELILTFGEIEGIIKGELPRSAFGPDARAWQNEDEEVTHPQAQAWRNAGYKVWKVRDGMVTFKRLNSN